MAVLIISTINVFIYLIWFLAGEYDFSYLMEQNFLVSWSALEEGRVWTLLTAAFSHHMFWHLFLNLYVLNSFGPIIETTLGFFRFVRFYLIAGIVSSSVHAFVSAGLLNKPDLPALGASGAISGIIILFSFLFPNQKILLFGILPVPAFFGALLFVGLDIWGLVVQVGGGGLPIGHGAHLGGALMGAIYYFIFLRKYRI